MKFKENNLGINSDIHKIISRLEKVIIELHDKEIKEWEKDKYAHGNPTTHAPLTYELLFCHDILSQDITDYFKDDEYKKFHLALHTEDAPE